MNNLKSTTLRPGLLVSLKTTVRGNVRYEKRTIERDHTTRDGALKAKWETERTISDPAEHEAATRVRSKARSLIASVCAHSAFGMLCPEYAADELDSAVAEARQLAEEFNRTATLSRVGVYVITGRIAPDDVEAVRAINSEVRELLDDMREGIKNLDVKAVREAASKAASIGQMLAPEAEARIKIAVENARTAARKLVKAGDQASGEIDRVALRRITEARTAFLDLDGADAVPLTVRAGPGRALDFDPGDDGLSALPPLRQFQMEV